MNWPAAFCVSANSDCSIYPVLKCKELYVVVMSQNPEARRTNDFSELQELKKWLSLLLDDILEMLNMTQLLFTCLEKIMTNNSAKVH